MSVRREGMPEVDEAFKVEALPEVDWPRLLTFYLSAQCRKGLGREGVDGRKTGSDLKRKSIPFKAT